MPSVEFLKRFCAYKEADSSAGQGYELIFTTMKVSSSLHKQHLPVSQLKTISSNLIFP